VIVRCCFLLPVVSFRTTCSSSRDLALPFAPASTLSFPPPPSLKGILVFLPPFFFSFQPANRVKECLCSTPSRPTVLYYFSPHLSAPSYCLALPSQDPFVPSPVSTHMPSVAVPLSPTLVVTPLPLPTKPPQLPLRGVFLFSPGAPRWGGLPGKPGTRSSPFFFYPSPGPQSLQFSRGEAMRAYFSPPLFCYNLCAQATFVCIFPPILTYRGDPKPVPTLLLPSFFFSRIGLFLPLPLSFGGI